ncbi:hypothetical protein EV182_002425, partial [Spiromyces aspiralis]
MVILTKVIGGATLGFAARTLAVALQGRPIFQKYGGLVAWAATGGALGFWYHFAQQRQLQVIEQRRIDLLGKRNKRHSEQQVAS